MLIGDGDLLGRTNDSAASTSGSMWVITLEIGHRSVEQLAILVIVRRELGLDDWQ